MIQIYFFTKFNSSRKVYIHHFPKNERPPIDTTSIVCLFATPLYQCHSDQPLPTPPSSIIFVYAVDFICPMPSHKNTKPPTKLNPFIDAQSSYSCTQTLATHLKSYTKRKSSPLSSHALSKEFELERLKCFARRRPDLYLSILLFKASIEIIHYSCIVQFRMFISPVHVN